MAMIFNSQVCLQSGISMLFQKGTFAYWSWFVGMVPRNLHVRGYLRQSDAWGFVVIFYSRKGGDECGCFLCADSSRVDGVSCH
jgi:hypothetical protein